jgi:hypothetical protein
VTATEFRKLALGFPQASEGAHMGYTVVRLRDAKKTTVRNALTVAWHNTAPKKLAQAYDVRSRAGRSKTR